MKYTRLTKRIADGEEAFLFHSSLHEGIERLAELEDKIERGELCDRKETARKILKSMLNKMYKLTGCGVPYHVKKFMEEIAMEYGVELFGNSDRVEGEE